MRPVSRLLVDTMSEKKDLWGGHLGNEDSLLDEDGSIEMQNPINGAPSILDNSIATISSANKRHPNLFSDDESEESSVATHCRGSTECGSMAIGTFMRPPTAISGRNEEDAEDYPRQPSSAGVSMADVDLGSTNRIMALREASNNNTDSSGNNGSSNNNSGAHDGSGSGSGGGGDSDGKLKISEGFLTAEPSPSVMMPGDGSSGGGELTEVR